MKAGARQTKDRTAGMMKLIRQLTGTRVLVGIPGDSAQRIEADGSVSPINNAAIGYTQEMGSPANNIPARPFLVPGVKEAWPEAEKSLKQAGIKALSGDTDGAERNFTAAGLKAQASVKRKMVIGPFKQLADSTLAARRRRGVTRTKPLIDTGNLQAHITYVLRKK